MPVQFLSEVDRERLSRFPEEIPQQDLKDFFWLSEDDHRETKRQRGEHNWLGFALQLCCLRYLGFFPNNFPDLPQEVVQFVAIQLQVDDNLFRLYGQRLSTQRKHQRQVQAFLGYRRAQEIDILNLEQWLLQRALEHDKPMRLLELSCDYLKQQKLVRLKPIRLARMVSTVRNKAEESIYKTLKPLLTQECQTFLDSLLEADSDLGKTRFAWLQQTPTNHNLTQMLETLAKIDFLQQKGIAQWDLSQLTPNRINHLSKIGSRATKYYMQRTPVIRRYPIMIAFLKQSLYNLTDNLIEMFDQRLWELYKTAKREFEDERLKATKTINQQLKTLREIGKILLDSEIEDASVRQEIFSFISPENLQNTLDKSEQLIPGLFHSKRRIMC